jgi:hypothetical protein
VHFHIEIYFNISNPAPFESPRGDLIPMTARPFHEYPESYWKLKNHEGQFLEIGSGYSSFMRELVESGLKTKPIIIEPANLQIAKGLLDFANKELSGTQYQPRIDRLLKTHEFLIDDSKVKLYNCTLGYALANYGSELKNTADIVIDYCGPEVYSDTEIQPEDLGKIRGKKGSEIKEILKKKVINLERELLKSTGILFANKQQFRK